MVRALRKPEVMDAVMGMRDCQTLAAGERRRGSLFCQHSSSLGGGKERGHEGRGTRGLLCAPASTQKQETSCFASAQTDWQPCFCVFWWQVWKAWGQTLPQNTPLWASPAHVPRAVSCQSSLVAGRLAPLPGSAGQEEVACGTGTRHSCSDGGAGWMGLFCAGDSAKRKECYQVVEGQAPKQQMPSS